MFDPSESIDSLTISGRTIDHTMLDRTILRHSPDVQYVSMEGGIVLLDVNSGRYYSLNRLGSIIWEYCTGHRTISDIHAVICDRFEVAPGQALDDVVNLMNQLLQEGLLQQALGESFDKRKKSDVF